MSVPSKELGILAIVPARAGSKRLPRKNALPLGGKPLIQWTFDAAKQSGVIDLIAVTSDDDEVLDIAISNGLVALRRPDYLASDYATSIDVVTYTLDILARRGITAKHVMLLQPTSPLRRPEDIQAAVRKIHDSGAASVISVCEMEHSPLWSNTLPKNDCMDSFLCPEHWFTRSQDLPIYYRLNGAIYLCRASCMSKQNTFFLAPSKALAMHQRVSIDIDDAFDLELCEFLIGRNNISDNSPDSRMIGPVPRRR